MIDWNLANNRYSKHANDRLQNRKITRQEIGQVIKRGYHEKRKDEYKQEYKCWNYSIRGTTVDDRNLRVIVSFDELQMLIITAIDLN